jgi:outer membrane protein OmpA-like peptidoglycan-associated protein/tetratricopeptide (TPR) repeat protein
MKINKIVYSIFFSVLVVHGYAQKARISAGDKQYDRYAYVDAIATYERVAEKGYKEEKMFQKLGNSYYYKADLPNAAKWYGELFALNQEQDPEYCYRYAQSLKSIGEYTKADRFLEIFSVKSGNDQRAKLFASHKNYLEEIKANSGRYEVFDAGVNSELSDYGSALYDRKLVFASSRDTGNVSKKVFKWDGQSFTNLYYSTLNSDGSTGSVTRLKKTVNSKFHESTPVFTKDGTTMYFTRNNYLNGKKGHNTKSVNLLKLYKATKKEGNWEDVVELSFNSDSYSVAHPSLSPDEKTLYFASDMPGTFGLSDLFKVKINADGSFGKPENLGNLINTEGRETFPFVSQENELYFASDGHQGLGGLDIFVSKANENSVYQTVQNVGAPVNSGQDDFAFLIDTKEGIGFFTSNRDGGKGFDDIYRFLELRKISCQQQLSGTITDLETKAILADTKVSLLDENFILIKEVLSDAMGAYAFDVVCGKVYYVRGEKINYDTKEGKVLVKMYSEKATLDLELEKRIKPIGIGTDLAKTLDIPIIHFDLDKSFIRKDATFELEKIAVVMRQYPKMKIDIGSHTDSRQTANYNVLLSERRAKSTRAWLVKNGIESGRLTAKGYGESRLLNNCTDKVKCTEAEHQANRRSEFVIVAME